MSWGTWGKQDYILIKFVPNKAKIISEKHQVLGDSITWEAPKLTL